MSVKCVTVVSVKNDGLVKDVLVKELTSVSLDGKHRVYAWETLKLSVADPHNNVKEGFTTIISL